MSIKTFLLATTIFAVTSPALAQQSQTPSQASTQAQRPSPFERADANKDGVMTLDEVRTARSAAFTRLDVNRDGFLVQSEMPRPPRGKQSGGLGGRQGLAAPRSYVMGRVILENADVNKDSTITRAEFDTAWQQGDISNAAAVSAQRTSMFLFLDADRDGVISSAEIASSTSRRQTFQMDSSTLPPGSFPPRAARAQGKNRLNLDTNNDQRVSLGEWLARPNPLFERGDANKDGRVTREEAAAIVRQGRGEGGRNQRPK